MMLRRKESPRTRTGGGILRPTLTIGVFLGCLLALLMGLGIFEKLEYKVLDLAFRYRQPIAASPGIMTIDIDDRALGAVGRWPWPWQVHSLVLDFLTLQEAGSVVFVDSDFSREKEIRFSSDDAAKLKDGMMQQARSNPGSFGLPDFTTAFYTSIGRNGRTFFTYLFAFPDKASDGASLRNDAERRAQLFREDKKDRIALLKGKLPLAGPVESVIEATDVEPPLAPVMEHAAGAGFNSILLDSDGVVRRYPLIASYRGELYPSLGLVSLMGIAKAKGLSFREGRPIELHSGGEPLRIPVNNRGEMFINWAGGYTDTFLRIPFGLVASLIARQAAKEALAGISLDAMADPLALQGMITERLRDLHVLPEDESTYTANVIFLSFIIEYYLRNTQYPLGEILASLGIDPADETWLTAGREIALNNAMVKGHRGSGRIPAFDSLLETMGYRVNPEAARQLRSSYDQARAFLERDIVDRVRPLYFGPDVGLTIGKKTYAVNTLTFRNKVVFYGLTATGLTAQHTTPFMERHPMLDLAPNVVNTVMTGRGIRLFSLPYLSFASLLAVLAAVMYLTPLRGFVVLTLGGMSHAALFWLAFTRRGYIIPVVTPLFSITASYISALVYRYFQEQKEKKKVRGMFATMVSPEVLKIMEGNPESFRLAGEQREATMFSSDVSGFTFISEGVTARELANILNIYLTPMSNIIMSYDGYVDKYEGDAIKAVFGVPLADPNHSWKACFAALYQQEELKVIQRMILLKYGVKITARMGINTGIVSAGNMGSEKRMQYTVMGEAVTLAEELEPANKLFESWIALGPETYDQVHEAVETRYLNDLRMGPSHQPIPVYELTGWKKDKYLEFWLGKPVPELALQSLAKMLPEKVIAYREFFLNGSLPPSRLLEDFRKLFGELLESATSYMMVHNAISIQYIREELATLRETLAARGGFDQGREMPEHLAKELSDLAEKLHGDCDNWERILLGLNREVKECAAAQSILRQSIPKEDADRYLAVTDILEKSIICIHKRITFPSDTDAVALDMARHLKELLLEEDATFRGKTTGTLQAEAKAIEEDIHRRLAAFAEQLKERADEYHRLLADFCVLSEERKRAIDIFRWGREAYLKRDWDEALRFFRQAQEIVPDGPSMMFVRKIEALRGETLPADWDGAWEEE